MLRRQFPLNLLQPNLVPPSNTPPLSFLSPEILFDCIGRGGSVEEVLSALEGKRTTFCCVRHINRLLIETLVSLISDNQPVLALGSGSGLLEWIILKKGVQVVGIDISHSINRFLPSENFVEASNGRAPEIKYEPFRCLFVSYPRYTTLIDSYVENLINCKLVVILGPIGELQNYKPVWADSVEFVQQGLPPYELIYMYRRNG